MYNDIEIPDNEECKSCVLTFAYNEMRLLYDIAVMLSNRSDVKESIEQGMRLLKRNSYLERCTLFTLSDDATSVELYASIELTPQQQKMATYKFGEGATGLAVQTVEPVVIENIHNNINYLNKLGTVNTQSISYIAVPIIQDNSLFGVISANIHDSGTLAFDEIVRMLTIVGTLFGGTISIQKKFDKEKENLNELKTYYKDEALSEYKFENIIGRSTKMQQIFSLLESELFGHEKGAFTDAKEARKGRFELADGGTLFLDEIGDITPSLQVKLLRILQEQEFERVGGTKTIKTNVRLVAATNRKLEEMVANGEFREDLFYRLNVIPINLPPLRERFEDVKLLIEHYLKKLSKEHRKQISFSKQALEILLDYPWPGNIRELQNTMERIVLICPEGVVSPEMLNHVLPFNYQKMHMEPVVEEKPVQEIQTNVIEPVPHDSSNSMLTKASLQEMEKDSIIQALIDNRGIQTKAAAQLGMTARQIGYKIRKYGIDI